MFYMLFMFYLQFQKKEYLNLVKVPLSSFCTAAHPMLAVWERVGPGPVHLTRMRGLSIKIKEICVLSVLEINIIGGQL